MLRCGNYILCNFPFRESIGPGPSPHIVCARQPAGRPIPGSQSSSIRLRRPTIPVCNARRQYLFVSKARAIALGQKTAFVVDTSRIARLPMTSAYFPEMTESTIAIRGNDADFVAKAEERLRELVARGSRITRVDAAPRNRT